MKEIHDLDYKANVLINEKYIISLRPYQREGGSGQSETCTRINMTNNISYIVTGEPKAHAHLLS